MLICTVLSYESSQLLYFDFIIWIQSLLKTSKHHFLLTWFQSIHYIGNWSDIVFDTVLNELFIKEVFYFHTVHIVINSLTFITIDPLLPIISLSLIEYHIYQFIITLLIVTKKYSMFIIISEIFFSFIICWCSQSFVILHFPLLGIHLLTDELIEVIDIEKLMLNTIMFDFYDGSNKLTDEPFDTH